MASDSIVEISAVLDFSSPDEAAANTFFEKLHANSGKAIWLNLEIIPHQPFSPLIKTENEGSKKNVARILDGQSGYVLREKARDSMPRNRGDIVCGSGKFGGVDNYDQDFELTFNHPIHFHSPTTIIIGNRQSYPFHSIICGVEDYTRQELTHLHIKGAFVVMSATIPTAQEITLFPYNP
ncbi:MAG: hypothetical protein COA52_07715 [Hyphomicrobiales bacterium]|nr:MAG: hypothetical protein COA52_07715 [Hyphomicrobiales bacterium]